MSRTFRRLRKALDHLSKIRGTPASERSWWDRLTFEFRSGRLGTKIQKRYCASIPPNPGIDPTVGFPHDFNGIHIAWNAAIGPRCVVYQHVTIGNNAENEAPKIGSGVVIGAGACIIGRVTIGDGAKIGANVALVDVNVPAGSTIVNDSAYDLSRSNSVYPAYKSRRSTPAVDPSEGSYRRARIGAAADL